jgi:hypothetical protein
VVGFFIEEPDLKLLFERREYYVNLRCLLIYITSVNEKISLYTFYPFPANSPNNNFLCSSAHLQASSNWSIG